MMSSFLAGMGGGSAVPVMDSYDAVKKKKEKEGLAGMLQGMGKKRNKNFDFTNEGPQAEQFGPSGVQGFLASLFGV